MRQKLQAAFFLLTLLFGQVAVNFFHTHHPSLALEKQRATTEENISSKVDQCNICAIDFLHGLVFHQSQIFFSAIYVSSTFNNFAPSASGVDLPLSSSRAPPAFLL
jgi:hypothetical protein